MSIFHVLRSQTHFRRYRARRVQFSYFALPDPFSVVLREPDLVIMFCAPGPDLGGIDVAKSSFQVLCSRTRFRRYRARPFQFSCFALSDSFLAV
jgi:hypothetical protein